MHTRISIITTGGTIDGADSDKKTSRAQSDAVEWLSAQPSIQIKHIPLMNKDSRLITDKDRQNIVQTALQDENNLIIITHGTFTICQTGRALKKHLKSLEKTILLVGAWVPFGEPNSDAEQQMSFALSILKSPRIGVFIAMDNHLWDPDTTEKKEIAPGVYRLETIAS